MSVQLITPNPHIPCKPGWCLQYVREAFGIYPGVQPTATAGWNASPTKHRDRNFPADKWIPLWFHLRNVPAGHVALMAPNGNVYSTSDDSNTPHCHPDLDDLINYYNRYGQPITYLGWTEDIEGVTVVDLGSASLGYDGEIVTTPTEEDDMFTEQDRDRLNWLWETASAGKSGYKPAGSIALDIAAARAASEATLAQVMPGETGVREAGPIALALAQLAGAPADTVEADAAAIAKAITPDLAKALLVELSKGDA